MPEIAMRMQDLPIPTGKWTKTLVRKTASGVQLLIKDLPIIGTRRSKNPRQGSPYWIAYETGGASSYYRRSPYWTVKKIYDSEEERGKKIIARGVKVAPVRKAAKRWERSLG